MNKNYLLILFTLLFTGCSHNVAQLSLASTKITEINGKPIYKEIILDNLIDIKDDGSYKLNMKFFKYHRGLRMISSKFIDLLSILFFLNIPAVSIILKFLSLNLYISSTISDVVPAILLVRTLS